MAQCRRGHAPAVIFVTNRGGTGGGCGEICLGCLAELLVDPSSFVTHKAYALAELSRSLEDDDFADVFLRYHSHFLVGPLCQSVIFCQDEALARATVDFILSLSRATVEDDRSLLNDFITFMSMQLGTRATIVWGKGQRFALHAMGLLLDLHGNMDVSVPRTIPFQALMENLVVALQHAGDDIKGEVLFLLYKVSSLKGGTEKLSNWLKRIIRLTVDALLKTESDELRANGIALLSVLARNAVFQLRSQELGSSERSSDVVGIPDDFVATFAEAIKGPLLSSDVQVQLSVLQLICSVCPKDVNISKELIILVDEGIADYVFEVLRVSESLSTLAVAAVRVLSVLSAAKGVFSQRVMLGVESLLRVLELSSGAGFFSVQEDALRLLADGIAECPGTVNSSKAEQIFEILARILEQRATMAGEAAENVSSGTYTVACETMVALLMTPGFSSISSDPERLLTVLRNVMTSVLHEHSLETRGLASSLSLLQQAFIFEGKGGERAAEFFSAFEQQLLPFLAERRRSFEEEVAVQAIFAFLTSVVRIKVSKNNNASGFSERLARDKWLSLAFANTGRFRSEDFKACAMTFVATLVDALDEDDKPDESILSALQVLSTDPNDLLAVLERTGAFAPSVQSAVVSIIYTSYTHSDRLVDPKQLHASLEQFVLLHASRFQADTRCLIRVTSLYAMLKQETSLEAVFSAEAENLLMTSIQQKETTTDFLCSKVPFPLRIWMLSQKGLKTVCLRNVYNLFQAAVSHKESDLEALCTVLEHENGVAFVNALLHKAALENVNDDIEMLTTVLKRMLEVKKHLVYQFLHKDMTSNMRNWYVLCGLKAPASTLICFIELLIRLLHTLPPETAKRKSGSWQDIVNQTIHIFLRKNTSDQNLTTTVLSFICLLCYQSSVGFCFLTDAAIEAFKNKDICLELRQRIQTSLERNFYTVNDEQVLCLGLCFQLLWLQQRKNGDVDEEAAVPYESLCRIIYSRPGLPRVLAFCCLSERLRQSTAATLRLDSVFRPSSLKSMLLLLQGFILDDNELVQSNASSSLLSLLTSKHLTTKQKAAVEKSPWYCFVAQEITQGLSSCTEGGVPESKMKLLVSLLKLSRASNWFASAFNTSSIASVISTLSGRGVSFWEVCFFLELLRMKCLEQEHIKELSHHYQTFRKACHQQKNPPVSKERRRLRGDATHLSESFLEVMEMVLSGCTHEVLETKAVLGKIDEFIREAAKT